MEAYFWVPCGVSNILLYLLLCTWTLHSQGMIHFIHNKAVWWCYVAYLSYCRTQCSCEVESQLLMSYIWTNVSTVSLPLIQTQLVLPVSYHWEVKLTVIWQYPGMGQTTALVCVCAGNRKQCFDSSLSALTKQLAELKRVKQNTTF